MTGWTGPGVGEPDADPFAEYDAAYVFGALAPEERAAYERHLQHCDACSESVAAMAGVPGLLARVPLDRIAGSAPEAAPDTLLPRLVAEVARDRRHTRWRAGAGVMLAAACVVALLVALAVSRDAGRTTAGASLTVPGTAASIQPGGSTSATPPTSPSTTAPIGPELTLTPVANVGVSASVQIQDVRWGTRITMTCHDATSAGKLPYSGRYYLVLVGRDQTRAQLAGWNTLPGKTVHIEGDTAWRRAAIASLLVVDDDHDVVLKLVL